MKSPSYTLRRLVAKNGIPGREDATAFSLSDEKKRKQDALKIIQKRSTSRDDEYSSRREKEKKRKEKTKRATG